MKYIAIDYGTKRTGIAVSDPKGILAFPRQTLVMTTRENFFSELLEVIHNEAPNALVIGFPVLLDGSETCITRQVRNFITRLSHYITLPIFLMKEVLSTYAAKSDLQARGYQHSKLKAVVDQQAAVHILQSFLDQPNEDRMKL